MMVSLPDNSEVNLNAESSIKYPPKSWAKQREVILTGEAFFKVAEVGTPFSVRSGFVVTSVLGTSFNVRARGIQVEVACVTGKVSVKSLQKAYEPVILSPGLASLVQQDSAPAQPYPFDLS
ncbi:MAG: FecR family protein, partial [bacterium]